VERLEFVATLDMHPLRQVASSLSAAACPTISTFADPAVALDGVPEVDPKPTAVNANVNPTAAGTSHRRRLIMKIRPQPS
jgi:hypothetical protein